MRLRATVLFLAGQLIFWPGLSLAQGPVIEQGHNKQDANAGTVTIMTTRNLGTAAMTAALNLSTLLDSGKQYQDMRVIPVVARGKVQNLWDILYLEGIDMGFVQSDILAYLEDDPRVESIKARICYITVMPPTEVHILARADIGSLEDLAGKKVSINAKGTGSSVVGAILFKRLGIDAILENEDTGRAIARMKEGDLAAHINVLGVPAAPVARIKKEDGIHLLPIPYVPELAEIYLPSRFTDKDYPALVPVGEEIETIAAGNLLAAFNWPDGHDRQKKLTPFIEAFFSRFEELQAPGFHPQWKKVNIAATLPGWTRCKPAQNWIDLNLKPMAAAENDPALEREFTAFITEQGSSPGISDDDKSALFEEFLKWRSSRQ
jgi:TRAP-type uncharacterized transport system substrate-binding protein